MKLHLFDATFELLRAYHGVEPSRAPDVAEEGAVGGLIGTTLALLRERDVTHLAAATGHLIRSFRNDFGPGCKTEEGVPEDLRAQVDTPGRRVDAPAPVRGRLCTDPPDPHILWLFHSRRPLMSARSMALAVAGIVMCLAAGPVAAQTKWSGGIKGGVSLAKITGSTAFSGSVTDGVDTIDLFGDIGDYRTGFAGGGFVTADVNEKFGIRAELLYAQKGGAGKLNVNFNGIPAGTSDITFKLDYIEIPVLLVGTFPTQGSTRLSVFGGPTVAFNTSSKLKFETQGQSSEQDIGDSTESTDFGLAFGAGASFAASPRTRIVVDGRYTLGLSKFFTSGEDNKNSAIQLMAGLSFPLGGGSGGQ